MKYVVIDLEMCDIPKMYRDPQHPYLKETIQIGAVLLDDKYDICDSFMTLVKPERGVISDRILKLTGISQKSVKNAPKMIDALKSFADWLPDEVTLVSWSESDLEQIQAEVEGKQIAFNGINKVLENWLDCQKTFSDIVKNPRKYKLVEAMNLSDIDYDDNMHDGLIDAKNTALLFQKMMTEEEFQFNQYYTLTEDIE